MHTHELLTAKQVSERFGFSERTLANWRWLGVGPAYIKRTRGRGGRVYYRSSDVEKWLADNTVKTSGGAA